MTRWSVILIVLETEFRFRLQFVFFGLIKFDFDKKKLFLQIDLNCRFEWFERFQMPWKIQWTLNFEKKKKRISPRVMDSIEEWFLWFVELSFHRQRPKKRKKKLFRNKTFFYFTSAMNVMINFALIVFPEPDSPVMITDCFSPSINKFRKISSAMAKTCGTLSINVWIRRSITVKKLSYKNLHSHDISTFVRRDMKRFLGTDSQKSKSNRCKSNRNEKTKVDGRNFEMIFT